MSKEIVKTKKILIDATHNEEFRMAMICDGVLTEYETENVNDPPTKGNIYLGKVVRVEPSLQSAFIDFGGNRHGFLPFNEIHPDYFHITNEERDELMKSVTPSGVTELPKDEEEIEPQKKKRITEKFKIGSVINQGQILMVQVVREERANKGAFLSTHISLPGRYSILMPNSFPGGVGISRKITAERKRRRIRKWLDTIPLPETMKVIVRSAGEDRRKPELNRDLKYLSSLWEDLKIKAINAKAPKLLANEATLIQRVVRDMFRNGVEEILIQGNAAYKEAKELMKKMSPSSAKHVKLHKNKDQTLFQLNEIESQIRDMFNHQVPLPSGGSIVIDQTEALVAIDVNSGKSNRSKDLSSTAYETNLEAVEVIARSLRLRDLAGLIVIDFIDMYEDSHIESVEKAFKAAVKEDRAKIQTTSISALGLFELSRQRKKLSIQEVSAKECSHCHGRGFLRSSDTLSLEIVRILDQYASNNKKSIIRVAIPKSIQSFIQNEKRREVSEIEIKNDVKILFYIDSSVGGGSYRIDEPIKQINSDEIVKEEIQIKNNEKKHSSKKNIKEKQNINNKKHNVKKTNNEKQKTKSNEVKNNEVKTKSEKVEIKNNDVNTKVEKVEIKNDIKESKEIINKKTVNKINNRKTTKSIYGNRKNRKHPKQNINKENTTSQKENDKKPVQKELEKNSKKESDSGVYEIIS